MTDAKITETMWEEFLTHARADGADLQHICQEFAGRIIELVVGQPAIIGLKGFKGMSITYGGQATEGSTEFLLVLRGFDGTKSPVVTFINGSTVTGAYVELLHRAATGGIEWREDKPRETSNKRTSFIDAVGGSGD